MKIKHKNDMQVFKNSNIYNATAYIQNHTLINRGITTLGGSTIPQCLMSNNKYEAQERATMGVLYFLASYLTPVVLLPLYNKAFLKNKGIIKKADKVSEKIVEISKKHLVPNANLKEAIDKTSDKLKNSFKQIYDKYSNEQKLKDDLLDVHGKILTADFITTASMWIMLPWIATENTEKKTKRSDFSAGFDLKQSQDKKENKTKKIIANILLATIPGILYSTCLTKALKTPIDKIDSKFIKNCVEKIQKNAQNFDYTSGTNMSKTIYASIWMLSSFPAKIISARDNNERKDRALRDFGLFTMFFGGDFLINNILGRISDKFFKTKVMDYDKFKGQNLNFMQKFKLPLKNLKRIDEYSNVTKQTKTMSAVIYWASLLTNTALIGFGLPKILNEFLRHNILKEKQSVQMSPNLNFSLDKFALKNKPIV